MPKNDSVKASDPVADPEGPEEVIVENDKPIKKRNKRIKGQLPTRRSARLVK